MTKNEALRLALEALENITSVSICEATHHPKKDRHLLCEECPNEVRHLKAITAIKSALEAKDEPVAWMCADESLINKGYARFSHVCMGEWKIPVYTTPLQRKPLTDEEIEAIAKEHIAVGTRSFQEFARRIEAAHGIKEAS